MAPSNENTANFSINPDITKKISTGSFLGCACGVATKRLTSDALYGVGLAMMGLQGLSYLGYITINWGTIDKQIEEKLDQNGDGKIDGTDFKIAIQKIIKFLSQGIPDAAGFSTGFFVGFRYLA